MHTLPLRSYFWNSSSTGFACFHIALQPGFYSKTQLQTCFPSDLRACSYISSRIAPTMQPPTHNPTFDPTALSVLADASFLDVEGTQSIDNTNSNSNSETDYGSALWPGEEHVQQDISALEQERDHLRVLLSQRQPCKLREICFCLRTCTLSYTWRHFS